MSGSRPGRRSRRARAAIAPPARAARTERCSISTSSTASSRCVIWRPAAPMRASRPLREGTFATNSQQENRARRRVGSRAQRHRDLQHAFGGLGDRDFGAARQRLADRGRQKGFGVLDRGRPVEPAGLRVEDRGQLARDRAFELGDARGAEQRAVQRSAGCRRPKRGRRARSREARPDRF